MPVLSDATLAEGRGRIAKALRLVEVACAAPQDEYGVLDLSGLETGETILESGTDFYLRKVLLRALRVISVTKGRGGPARLEPAPRENAEEVRLLAERIWGLFARADSIAPEQLAALQPATPELIGSAVWLLKELQLVAGIQRAGGLRPFQDLARELEEATGSDEAPVGTGDEAEHEKAYYDGVALALRESGFFTSITGVRHRAAGRWNTPDVVGFYVRRNRALVVPLVRVATVEVKHLLDRVAIAEAESHTRFGHYTYVAVPTPFDEIDKADLADCTARGLGLIAPGRRGGRFEIQLESALHRPDEEDVDVMLGCFTDDQGAPLEQLVATEVRAAFTTLLC